MLRVSGLRKGYGADLVLEDVPFILNDGERAGLVGPNGSGKSTLLRLLAGQIEPDLGSVWVDPHDTIAYLPQYPHDELDRTLRQALLRGAGRVGELHERVTQLEDEMVTARGERLHAVVTEYAEAHQEFEALGGYELDGRIEEVVAGLALATAGLDTPVAALSGGNKTKLSLARLLLSNAGVLLLDEPTNFLDLPALLWLERFIDAGNRSYVIVSHDRRFLDRTVNTILELDLERHTLRQWPGSFSAYAEARLREEQKRLEAYRDQQAEIAKIEDDIRRTRDQARTIDKRTQSDYKGQSRYQLGVDRVRAGKVARKASVRERKLDQLVDGADTIEKPRRGWGLHLVDLGRDILSDDSLVLDVQGLHAGYDGREVLHGVSLYLRGRDRVALMGNNGSGKTTLIRCLAGATPFEGTVRIGPSIRLGILSQENDELPVDRSVLSVFRARTVAMHEDEARTYLHKFLFTGDEVHKQVATLSYGQRAKLALAILILSDANFLVLDEPTSHLDIPALEAVESALAQYAGPLLVVSHDRYFLERIDINRVEVMTGGRLSSRDSLEEYERALLFVCPPPQGPRTNKQQISSYRRRR